MGHIRLGRLPKSKQWHDVFDSLQSDAVNSKDIARSASRATQQQFQVLKQDRSLNHCFWILVRIATAARGNDFTAELKRLGVRNPASISPVSLVAQIARAVEAQNRAAGTPSVFSRMAELTLRKVLSDHIVSGSQNLFGQSGLTEIQQACREISTQKHFGNVAREFFAGFTSRCFGYIADKELSNSVGPDKAISSPVQASKLHEDLTRYCYEASKIIEEFAGGWFSKHNWETNSNISANETSGFTAYALEKLAMDLEEGQR